MLKTIIEIITKPEYQLSIIDKIKLGAFVLSTSVIIGGIIAIIKYILNKRDDL